MQTVLHLVDGAPKRLSLPPPDAPIGDNQVWGRHDELCTPAYWAAQSWIWGIEEPEHFRLGRTFEEELLACLLGGHGIPAEVGLAAYDRLRGFRRSDLSDERTVKEALVAPLAVGGRSVRYRFASQKARFVSSAFTDLEVFDRQADDRSLRDALTKLHGVGLKTASWVVRNHRASDQVAILDIHILRAGLMLRIFPESQTIERHYRQLEDAFLQFAERIETRASLLDSVIWMTMRRLPKRLLHGMLASNSNVHAAPIRGRAITNAA